MKIFTTLLALVIFGASEALIFMLLFNYFANTFNMPHFGFFESWGLLILIFIVGHRFNNKAYLNHN